MSQRAIFIGYRRDDTGDVAGRIYDALGEAFGRGRIFKDVDNLRPGEDFTKRIRGVLSRCRVALILIGPNWVEARDSAGRRRLDDPSDLVRIEIETGLATPRLILVPVLVNGARMPLPHELSPSLHPFLSRHAAHVRRDPDFRDDIARLAASLVGKGVAKRPSLSSGLAIAGSAIAIAVGGYAAWMQFAPLRCLTVERESPPADSEQWFEFQVRLLRDNYAINTGARCKAELAARLAGLEMQSWNHILSQVAAHEDDAALLAAYEWHLTLFPQGSNPPPRYADQAAARISALRESIDPAATP